MSDGQEKFQTTEEYQEEKNKGTESEKIKEEVISYFDPEAYRRGRFS